MNFKLSQKGMVIGALLIITAAGFFLRSYHFADWLHFELDQARDARVIDLAFQGDFFDLPLLGPKAGGTYLRLAPGYYYLQYASGLAFGETPSGIAIVVLVFSVLAIPLFYALLRRFFTVPLALGLTAVFAVSHFFVMYGRFAWNPNLAPFFIILTMYALLRAVDPLEIKKGRWFLLGIFALTLATHFHFLVFLTLPAIAALFLLIRRPRYSWKTWLGAIVIMFVLYSPLILNEIEAEGANTEEFFGAITEKSNREDHSLFEKGVRNISEHALHGIVVLTGFEGATFPVFSFDDGFGSQCTGRCDEGKWYGLTGIILFGLSVLVLAIAWWREKDRPKSDFLLLSGLWLLVTFGLFLPLAYGFAPRFFLISGPLFIILFGLLLFSFERAFRHFPRSASLFTLLVICLLLASNLYFLSERFNQLARAGQEQVVNEPDRILKERIRVTLEQQEEIVNFLERRSQSTGYPVYMFSEPQHRRALKYLLERRGIQNDVLGFSGIYTEGVYYLILRAQSDLEDGLRKYREHYTIGETTRFGTLVAIELLPMPEAIHAERQDFSKNTPTPSYAPPRYTWREFFQRNALGSRTDGEPSELEEIEDALKDQ